MSGDVCSRYARVSVLRACGRMKKSLIVKMAAPNVQLFKYNGRSPPPRAVNNDKRLVDGSLDVVASTVMWLTRSI